MLDRAYAENKQSHVAFIDESYLSPSLQLGQFKGNIADTFYVTTAYLVPCSKHEDIRADLASIVGGYFWHTTQAHQKGDHEQIEKLCTYIAEGGFADEHMIVSVKRPVDPSDGDAEIARAECLGSLLAVFEKGTLAPAVSLMVYEERKYQKQRNADERLIKSLRADRTIARNTRVFAASPSYERLLWLPDIVAFAEYHRQTNSQFRYGDPFADQIRYITNSIDDGRSVVKQEQPPSAVAIKSGAVAAVESKPESHELLT